MDWMEEGHKANGRFRVYLPDHPRANKGGYVLRSIAAYEVYHGVEVPREMFIHHINGDTLDDSKENLERMTRSEHLRHHTDNWGYYHRSL